MLIECYYALEDFGALGELMRTLPDGSSLLFAIGEKFQAVGLCGEGVAAFLKVCVCLQTALMLAKSQVLFNTSPAVPPLCWNARTLRVATPSAPLTAACC